MFDRLRQKWNVSWLRFTFIFITFAAGGSLCGYTGRLLMTVVSAESQWIRIPLYLIIVTVLWPVCVLLVSLPLGQFSFFCKYLSKMARRIRGKQPLS